jgi:hypothetical protein
MFFPQTPGLLVAADRARQSDASQQAGRNRLTLRAIPTRPRLSDRVLAAIGDLLIAAGTELQGTRLYQGSYQTVTEQ